MEYKYRMAGDNLTWRKQRERKVHAQGIDVNRTKRDEETRITGTKHTALQINRTLGLQREKKGTIQPEEGHRGDDNDNKPTQEQNKQRRTN